MRLAWNLAAAAGARPPLLAAVLGSLLFCALIWFAAIGVMATTVRVRAGRSDRGLAQLVMALRGPGADWAELERLAQEIKEERAQKEQKRAEAAEARARQEHQRGMEAASRHRFGGGVPSESDP